MEQQNWKAILCDWEHLQTYSSDGTLACLSGQQRQTILTYLQVAYWATRWENPPDEDTLNAFVAKIEDILMADCEITIRQDACSIELLINGEVVSSFELDGEACPALKGETGATGATGATGEKGDTGEDGSGFPAPEMPVLAGTEEEKKTQVFSGAMELVEYLQEKILDFYNAAQAAASAAHAVTAWIGMFPVIETLSPIDNMLEAADEFLEATLAAFEANDTPEFREKLACEIFCIIVQNDYVFDMYAWNLTLLLWNALLLSLPLNPARIHYLTIGIFWPYNGLANRYILGLNDDNEDWLLLCDCEGGACGALTFDMPEDLDYLLEWGTIEPIGNPLQGIAGEETEGDPPWPYGRRLQVRIDLGEDRDLTAVSFDYKYDSTIPGGYIGRYVQYFNSAMEQIDSWYTHVIRDPAVWHNAVVTMPGADVRYVMFSLRMVWGEDQPTAYVYGDNILIHCS